MKGILFASFGTTHESARKKQIDAVAKYIESAFPDRIVAQAYTSEMVRRSLASRGQYVPNTAEALQQLAREGVNEVIVQPGHLLPGEEYAKLCRLAEECRGLFSQLSIGQPLINDTADMQNISTILSEQYPTSPHSTVVLMGHGTSWFANAAYAALEYHFVSIGRRDIHVGTVEAYPALEEVVQRLQETGRNHVLLAPLMLVAGDHAINDMAGENPDSWASQLKRAGYDVECRLVGLGELPAIQQMYADHVRQAQGEK